MTQRRIDTTAVDAFKAAPETLFLPMHDGDPLLAVTGAEDLRLGLLASEPAGVRETDFTVFLGVRDAAPYFAFDIGTDAARIATLSAFGPFQDLRRVAAQLPRDDLAIACQAKALFEWHGRSRFCPRCGAQTVPSDGGNKRDCPACHAELFPRTDPAVITLVTNGPRCLLARNAKWISNPRFSAVAGFVEAGETLEEAVARETFEEVGVRVTDVRYFASQPWPFPGSLMMGFRAETADETFRLDPTEIAEARWFTRAEADDLLRGRLTDFAPPMSTAIAHAMISSWIAE